MDFIILLVALACLVLVMALIGLIQVIVWIAGSLFSSSEDPPRRPPAESWQPNLQASAQTEQPTLAKDITAAKRLIEYLHRNAMIDQQDLDRILRFLDQDLVSNLSTLPPDGDSASASATEQSSAVVAQTERDETSAAWSVEDDKPVTQVSESEQAISGSEAVFPASRDTETMVPDNAQDEIIVADLVTAAPTPPAQFEASTEAPVDTPLAQLAESTTPTSGSGAISDSTVEPEPWDVADAPPVRAPRRSLAEMLSSFMEERNMRWGELTSGILIILSAVGLIVSLRDQLTDRIPYFSALLFLLITAAIHGAGIYTLKQWRLRNTSRGTLIIGLLLIPINFLAACILNGNPDNRADLTDPWYWIAMAIGLGSFGVMSYWSSKLLFKRGIWPLVGGTLGIGAATLWINRAITPETSTLQSMLYALPILGSFLIGSILVSKGQWTNRTYTRRSATRLYTFLALASFGAATAIALVALRASSIAGGFVITLPMLAVMGTVIAWIGMQTRPGDIPGSDETDPDTPDVDAPDANRGSVGASPMPEPSDAPLAAEMTARQRRSQASLIGLALQVFGVLLTVGSLGFSVSNPTVFTIAAFGSAIALGVVLTARGKSEWLPLAWLIMVSGGWFAMLQISNKLPFDQWLTSQEALPGMVNAPSGLYLLFAAIATAIGTLLFSRIQFFRERPLFLRVGMLASLATLLVGSLVAVGASLLHRELLFEVMVANVLLLLTAIASCLAAGYVTYSLNQVLRSIEQSESPADQPASLLRTLDHLGAAKILPHLNLVVLAGALVHLLVWDPRVHQWLLQQCGANESNWQWLVPWLLASIGTGTVAAWLGWQSAGPRMHAESDADHADPTSIDFSRDSLLQQELFALQVARPTALTLAAGNMVWAITLLTAVGISALLLLVPGASGWATGFLLTSCLGWYWIGNTLSRVSTNSMTGPSERATAGAHWLTSVTPRLCMLPLLLVGCGAMLSGTSELALAQSWIGSLFDSTHMLTMLLTTVISASIIILARSISKGRKANNFLTKTWQLDYGLIAIAGGLAILILGDQVMRGAANEIWGDQPWGVNALASSLFASFDRVPSGLPWLSLGSLLFVCGLAWLERPARWLGMAVIGTVLLGFAFAATTFEASKSVATATRWLMPIGGSLLAMLVPVRHWLAAPWALLRNRLAQPGRSAIPANHTQQLVNLILIISTIAVLLISTITTAQVLLNSPTALGGPLSTSLFRSMPLEANFGVPLMIIVATFLWLAISERRRWLASFGSGVFQFVVLMALYFLITSPHEKLASRWFVGILQTVSLGMTGYGLVWYFFRDRVNGILAGETLAGGMAGSAHAANREGGNRRLHLQVHGLVNGALITGMAGVILFKVFIDPTSSVGWISSFGSWMGMTTLVAFVVLVGLIWRKELLTLRSTAVWTAITGWAGVVVVSLIIAVADRSTQANFVPWSTHKIGSLGLLIVGGLQVLTWLGINRWFAVESVQGIEQAEGIHSVEGIESIQRSNVDTESRSTGGLFDRPPWSDLANLVTRGQTLASLAIIGAIGATAAIHGLSASPDWFWVYAWIVASWSLMSLAGGIYGQRNTFGFVASAIASLGFYWVCKLDPNGWFTEAQPYWLNLTVGSSCLMATIWTAWLIYLQWSAKVIEVHDSQGVAGTPESAGAASQLQGNLVQDNLVGADVDGSSPANSQARTSIYPNTILMAAVGWLSLLAMSPLLNIESINRAIEGSSFLNQAHGITALVGAWLLFLLATLGNRYAWGQVFAAVGLTLSVGLTVCHALACRPSGYLFAVAAVVALWGLAWINRVWIDRLWVGRGTQPSRSTWFEQLEETFGKQLPVYSMLLLFPIMFFVATLILGWRPEARVDRYLVAMAPVLLAFTFGCLSNSTFRRYLQFVSLGSLTAGMVFLSVAELPSEDFTVTKLLVRTVVVLGGTMFVFGAVVTRWVRHGDSWLQSLRQMSGVICGGATVSLFALIAMEAVNFVPDEGCGLSFIEAAGVGVVIAGLIAGLVIIAVRPEHDPFALTLSGRQGYVYAAQLIAAGLVAHLYFSSPWLFQFGLRKYWPFVAMAICFIGIGISELLKRRKLDVLAFPLFNAATLLPALVAGLSLLDSPELGAQFRPAQVMLVIGLIYLLVCYLRKTVLSGAACILFGNAALLLFFHEYPSLAFLEHPQLWLIPPAVSVLIASQLLRDRIPSAQLTTVRYVSTAVIYISSTSEIYIQGIGDSLWPPVILAILSVSGVFTGILFRVRSFLYLGSLFLLLAMLSMVSHAHQRFNHVWPWWAFGIGLGIAILVMFGLFEKRKNDLKALAGKFRQWDG